jgi:cytochrome b561
MPSPLHWYVALAVVLILGAVFVVHVARDGRREWLESGRTTAAYDEALRRYRRRHLPLFVLLVVLFLLGLLGFVPDRLARYYFPLVPVVVFVPPALHDLWKDRRRIAQDRSWRAKALWHLVLLLALFGMSGLVVPFLLRLP